MHPRLRGLLRWLRRWFLPPVPPLATGAPHSVTEQAPPTLPGSNGHGETDRSSPPSGLAPETPASIMERIDSVLDAIDLDLTLCPGQIATVCSRFLDQPWLLHEFESLALAPRPPEGWLRGNRWTNLLIDLLGDDYFFDELVYWDLPNEPVDVLPQLQLHQIFLKKEDRSWTH